MTVDVTRPRAQGYGCRIGEDYFRIAPSREAPLRVLTQDSLAKRQDESGQAGENVLEIGYPFGRQNMTGGEGLDWWPRGAGEPRQEIDKIRFWDSANIDIRRPKSGEAYSSKLVRDLATFATPTASPVDMGASHDAVYVAEGSNVLRFDDWGDNTADDTDDLTETIVQLDVGVDDTVVAVLDNGDVAMKPDNSDTFVTIYDASGEATPGIIAAWWVKGRIIAAAKDSAAADAGQMLEIDPGISGTPAAPTSANTVTLIDTYQGDMLSCVDAGHAIVAGFSDGSVRSYVPQTDSAGGTPVLTIRGQTKMPKRESPITLGWSLGQLLILTLEEAPTGDNQTLRLYTAPVLDERFDFVVGGGEMQLLRVWEGTTESSPAYTKEIVTSRDEAFFAVGEGTDDWSIWRFDFVTQGLFRHMKAERSAITGLTLFDNLLAFCDGGDVVLESATDYVASGYVITPNITFGLNTPIAWSAFVLEVLGLNAPEAKVELLQSTNPEAILDPDSSSWQLVESYTDPAQSGIERGEVNIEANQIALQVKWYRSQDSQDSPDLKRFAVRGLPKHRDWVVEMPINVSDIVSAPGRMPLRVPHHGDRTHTKLVQLQGASTELRLYDTPLTLRGIVSQLLEPVTYMTDRGSQGRYCVVRFLGKIIGAEELSSVQGNAGMGVAQAGVSTMGIGEVQ